MATLSYFDHSSMKLKSSGGIVIYIDPFAQGDYSEGADIILVTHDHFDHNAVSLVNKNPSCTVITQKEAQSGGKYNTFSICGIKIEATEAYNKNHKKEECVGYIITVDGIKIYHAGDTSKTEQMYKLRDINLDYALLPMDGFYNMDVKEASECASVIGAKHSIPIHTAPRSPEMTGVTFSKETAEKFSAAGKIIVYPGETITL